MMTSWRAIVTATAVAVVTTTGVAAAVTPAPAPREATPIVAAHPAATTSKVSSAALPPVTVHELDPQLVAAAQAASVPAASQTVTEVIQLTIIGGDLSLETDHAAVTLERVPGSDRDWSGALPPVRVIDARGTHQGWDVRWTVTELAVQGTGKPTHAPDAKVHLEPGAPVVVDGTPDGLVAGKGGPAVHKGRILFGAATGSGGGTYEAGGTISLRLPTSVHADSVVVELAFSLS